MAITRRPGRTGARRASHMRWAPYLLSVIVLLGLWQALAEAAQSNFFPAPIAVAKVLYDDLLSGGLLLTNALVTLKRELIGFSAGCVVGAILGLIMGGSRTIGYPMLSPYVHFFRFLPATAMITVAAVWFGQGDWSKVFIVFLGSVWFVLLNTEAGMLSVSEDRIRGARALGASGRQIFWWVKLPSSVRFIVVGMRLGLTNGVSTVVAAEMIISYSGLGHVITNQTMFLRNDIVMSSIVLLGAIGLTLDRLQKWIAKTFLSAYQ